MVGPHSSRFNIFTAKLLGVGILRYLILPYVYKCLFSFRCLKCCRRNRDYKPRTVPIGLEPHSEKTNVLHMRKQRRRSASR